MEERREVKTWIGLDIDDKCTNGFALDSHGRVIESKRMFTPLLEWKEWVCKFPQPRYVMFEECTLAQWFFENLLEKADGVIVCEPRENAWINKSNNKSDPRDAYKIAELLRLRRYKEVYHSTEPGRVELRRQAKHYISLKKESSRWQCRIKSRFKEFGIFPGSGIFDLEKRKDWLGRLPHNASKTRIGREFEILDSIEEQKDAALRSMNAYAGRFPEVSLIRTIPGFGPVSSPIFVGLIMAPKRFNKRQELWTYCRLGITSRESGGKKIRRDRLDRWNGHGILKDISRKAFLSAHPDNVMGPLRNCLIFFQPRIFAFIIPHRLKCTSHKNRRSLLLCWFQNRSIVRSLIL